MKEEVLSDIFCDVAEFNTVAEEAISIGRLYYSVLFALENIAEGEDIPVNTGLFIWMLAQDVERT